jgi:ABC-type lipoprotein export system ATPase subunit
VLELRELTFAFENRPVFENINFQFDSKKLVTISGHSGSGKSLLLSIMGGLKLPTRGDVFVEGVSVYNSNFYKMQELKKRSGICFQVPALISNLTIKMNLMLALDINFPEMSLMKKSSLVSSSLAMFELKNRLEERPATLSLGQQYLIAFIRATISNPDILFWDEPFVNIDEFYHDKINEVLNGLRNRGCLIVFFTNRAQIIKEYGEIKLIIKKGMLVDYEI